MTNARRRLAYLICCLLAFFCLAGNANSAAEEQVVYYTGSISPENNQRFFKSIEDKPVKWLVIKSNGGDVEAGIKLATWLFDNNVNIEIDEYCLSSCANYVFPAAKRKVIRPGAVVAWHGNYHHLQYTGLWRDDIEIHMRKYGESRKVSTRKVRRQMRHLVGLEKMFFKRIGVNEFVCRIGKQAPYKVPNYYFLSRQDMLRFGIRGVQVSNDYTLTDVSEMPASIRFIRLDK